MQLNHAQVFWPKICPNTSNDAISSYCYFDKMKLATSASNSSVQTDEVSQTLYPRSPQSLPEAQRGLKKHEYDENHHHPIIQVSQHIISPLTASLFIFGVHKVRYRYPPTVNAPRGSK